MGHPLCVRHSAVLTKPKIQCSRGQARLPLPPCRKLNLTPLSTDRPTSKTKHTYKTTPLMTERGSEVIPKSEWSCDFWGGEYLNEDLWGRSRPEDGLKVGQNEQEPPLMHANPRLAPLPPPPPRQPQVQGPHPEAVPFAAMMSPPPPSDISGASGTNFVAKHLFWPCILHFPTPVE